MTTTYDVPGNVGRALAMYPVQARDQHAARWVALNHLLRANRGRWVATGFYGYDSDDTAVHADARTHSQMVDALRRSVREGRIEKKVTDADTTNARTWYRFPAA